VTIPTAKEVLRVEAEAILALIDKLGAEFECAVDMMLACEGRVVVSGMGKAGIIARKISATLASTGTPSVWLHPAEAVHGDIGMVTGDDVVIALSNSGETDEILKLLPVIKKIGAKLVALTGNLESPLAQYSDCVLDVGVSREACPLGLAPTASTTAALALGDALAMVLLKRKGFNTEKYGLFHPAGMLGRTLLKVSDVMRTGDRDPVVTAETPVRDVLFAITGARAGAASVVDKKGTLVGIFTDGDLRRALEQQQGQQDVLEKHVSEVMTRDPFTIGRDNLAMEAVRIAKEHQIGELPVVDDSGKPVGVFNVKDVIGE
jgi:arabinose-5-phosphate isomerase